MDLETRSYTEHELKTLAELEKEHRIPDVSLYPTGTAARINRDNGDYTWDLLIPGFNEYPRILLDNVWVPLPNRITDPDTGVVLGKVGTSSCLHGNGPHLVATWNNGSRVFNHGSNDFDVLCAIVKSRGLWLIDPFGNVTMK